MIYKLAYGKTGFEFSLPDKCHADVIEPVWTSAVADQRLAVSDALCRPYGLKPLKEISGESRTVAIIFSDITRATPYDIILPPLLSELGDLPRENISFFCANGTHRPATEEELIRILGEEVCSHYQVIQNKAGNPETHQFVGTTHSGNEIFLNKRLLECDLKILTGFIEPHFFAGFSGGGKALIPGMASEKTIKYNHSIAHLSNKNVNWGITCGNPLWEEIMEAAEFVPGLFLLNVTLNRNREITGVFAGELRAAHRAGCDFARKSAMVPVDHLYDIVITSNSGHPLDLNVYQTVKGMSAASQIIKERGSIIMAAECWDGIPSGSDYETILTSAGNPGELMKFIVQNESTLKDTWQIYYQALIQQKADVYLFSDRLDDDTVGRALFRAAGDIGVLTEKLAAGAGPQAEICVMPEGPLTIPYLK